MSNDQITGLTMPANAGTTPAGANKTEAQVKQLAQEFEAMLLTQMLKDLRHTMASDESSPDGYGADAMSDTTDLELGRALSRSGGFGLTAVLLRAIVRQATPAADSAATASAEPVAGVGVPSLPIAAPVAPSLPLAPSVPVAVPVAPVSGRSAVAMPVVPTPAVESLAPPSGATAPVATTPKGPITSGYGWRRDPFTGAAKFHSGVDVGLAYGTPVRAAAAGEVVFSGANGGYGNMVVIERPSGQQVRYAHLSAQAVRVGDVVEHGQVIGQVGDTGRATGPHLHVEVIENGRAVDPGGLH
jgi:flagellar protein FlgJ